MPPPSTKLHQQAESLKGRALQRKKSGGDWKTPRATAPEGMEATKILFGRGQRHYRDDEDAEGLVRVMREAIREEWEREFGGVKEVSDDGNGNGSEKEKEIDGEGGKGLPIRGNGGKL